MIEIISPKIPTALLISKRFITPQDTEKIASLLGNQVELHTYIHFNDPRFIDKQTKVPVLITHIGEILEHIDLIEERGVIIALSYKYRISYSEIHQFLSITSQATAREIEEDKVLLIGIKSGRRPVPPLREHQLAEVIKKEIKLEEEPVRIKLSPQHNIIKFKSVEQVLEELREKLDKEAKEKIKPKTTFTTESLAPPKDGHVLMMIASGLVDGQYDDLLIKGTSKKLIIEEEDEEGKKIRREVPKINIRVLNTKTFEFFEIE